MLMRVIKEALELQASREEVEQKRSIQLGIQACQERQRMLERTLLEILGEELYNEFHFEFHPETPADQWYTLPSGHDTDAKRVIATIHAPDLEPIGITIWGYKGPSPASFGKSEDGPIHSNFYIQSPGTGTYSFPAAKMSFLLACGKAWQTWETNESIKAEIKASRGEQDDADSSKA